MIHKGKAHMYLKEFDKAQLEFENAKQTDSKQASLIDGRNILFECFDSKLIET